ncbi:MAG: anthranilate synthase component I, partial [Verrucomicrobia bacterium]
MKPLITPSLNEFLQLAKQGNVIPVFAEFVGDCETPVSAFKKFSSSAFSFLFESTEKNDLSGRFSFVGFDPRMVIQSYGREIHIARKGIGERFSTTTDPLDEVRKLLARYQFVSHPELPRFAGGAVGFLGYEAVRFFEPKVLAARQDDLQLPEMLFMLTGNVLIFDHRLRSLKILVNAFLDGGSPEKVYARAVESLDSIMQQLSEPTDLPLVAVVDGEKQPPPRSNFRREDFQRAVERAKEYIRAGDIFQVVLSQRFESPFNGGPLDFYRCLRFINPSPYMFCLNFGDDFALVGSSPEMHVRLVGNTIEIRPIAGTRARGLTPAHDEANAAELLADPKERAEHIMLVDLARNDVGRVAEFGTVRVTEMMEIERYSHVMHIVSNVVGRSRAGCTAFDVVRATFPAGTVSGAPKIRAMQIISELENTRRGCYAGAIGYFGFDGNFDSCIALRCAVLKNGRAYFQAGAGIVADSDPQREYEETVNKARAPDENGMNTQGAISEVGNVELRRLIARLMRGENLARSEAANFLNELLSPPATDAQVAAALALLAAKGETVEELAGMAEAMRDRAIQLRSRHARFIDTAGTGSSRAKTFNVSTAAAFVIAGAGLPVAKHGSRAAT